MGSEVAAQWAGVAVSIVFGLASAIGAVLSWYRANLSAKARAEAEAARQQAEELLDAARQQATAAAQSADAVTAIAQQFRAEQQAPPWRIEWQRGDTFALINAGHQTMHNVNVSCDVPHCAFDAIGFPADIDARSSRSFCFAQTLASGPQRLMTVSWTWPDGRQDQWTGEIPRN